MTTNSDFFLKLCQRVTSCCHSYDLLPAILSGTRLIAVFRDCHIVIWIEFNSLLIGWSIASGVRTLLCSCSYHVIQAFQCSEAFSICHDVAVLISGSNHLETCKFYSIYRWISVSHASWHILSPNIDIYSPTQLIWNTK